MKKNTISGKVTENVKTSLDGLNSQFKEIVDELVILGKSSLSVTKMLMGKEINHREAEVAKSHIKDLGNACISFAAAFLPGAKKMLPFLGRLIERPPIHVITRVVDENMKEEWLQNIVYSLESPSVIDKLLSKIKKEQ